MLWWNKRLCGISRGKTNNLISPFCSRKCKPRPTSILASMSLKLSRNSKWGRKRLLWWCLRPCLHPGEKKAESAKVLISWRDQYSKWIRWCRCRRVGIILREIRLWTYCFRRKVKITWQVLRLRNKTSCSQGNPSEKWVKEHMDKWRLWTVSIRQIAQEYHSMCWRKIKLLEIAHRWHRVT